MKKFLGVTAFIVAFGLVSNNTVWAWLVSVVPVWVFGLFAVVLVLFLALVAVAAFLVAVNYDKLDQ